MNAFAMVSGLALFQTLSCFQTSSVFATESPLPGPSSAPVATPVTASVAAASAEADYALTDKDARAKVGYYSSRVLKFLDKWPPATLSLTDDSRDIYTRAIRTPNHPKIIGIVKHLNVTAPLERLVALNENFEDYPKIWENVVSVKVESRDRNRIVTDWTRKAPTFFMPNLRFRVLYTIDKSKPGRVVYKQQLIDGNALNESDALVVLEKRSENLTRVSVVNFFDPDAGPFRSLVEGVIWDKSFQNSYKDDVAFRARAEHSNWNLDRIEDESDQAWDKNKVSEIPFTDLLKFD